MKFGMKLALSGIIFVLILVGGGVWYHMDQNKKELAAKEKLVEIIAPQVDEFYKWNYLGVKTTKVTALERNPVDGSPYAEAELTLENKKKVLVTVDISTNQFIFDGFGKNQVLRPGLKVPESSEYDIDHEAYLLQIKDIKKLKKDGYTKKVSGQEIKHYLFKTYPEKFKGVHK